MTSKEHSSRHGSADCANWRSDMVDVCGKLGIPCTTGSWSSSVACRGVPDSDRMKSMLDVALMGRRRQNRDLERSQIVRDFWLDLSQPVRSLNRQLKTGMPALEQKSIIYSYEYDIVLTAEHCMMLMCFPSDWIGAHEDMGMRAVAAGTPSAPIMSMLLTLAYSEAQMPH